MYKNILFNHLKRVVKISHKIDSLRFQTHFISNMNPPDIDIDNINESSSLHSLHSSPHSLFIHLIDSQRIKETKQDIWKDSPYRDIVKLQSNNAGIVGENYIQYLCDITQISASIDGTKTRKIGGGSGDGIIKNKSVEIKTAHQGCSSCNFQHELGEIPWNTEYMIFIDISPLTIYLTIFKNFSEEHYKSSNKCVPYFPTKSITWRKGKGAFKLDTSVTINENNVIQGYTLKINNTTTLSQIHDFIQSQILE